MINIFGTDGVRGKANEGYITPENVTKLAIAAASYFASRANSQKLTVVIGKDTRLSGYMLESAMTAGFISAGADVILLGPIPTPAVSFLTRSLRADLGVVISASHNPFDDNGIKFNDAKGWKISQKDELAITDLFSQSPALASHDHLGKAKRLDDATGRYIEFVKSTFPRDLNLSGVKIALDVANGAAYKVLPNILWELGADVTTIADHPDGLNINLDCGATHPEALQRLVLEEHADIGFAVDGDADRLIVVDENGQIVDGDFIIAAIASWWKLENRLKSNTVVVTEMSNSALYEYFAKVGIKLEISAVGDKNVVQKMKECSSNLGGEKNGHIIALDYAASGDGSIAALQVLAFLQKFSQSASSMRNLFAPRNQILKNIPADENIEVIMSHIKTQLKEPEKARFVIRRSGTEPLWRIMIESHEDLDKIAI